MPLQGKDTAWKHGTNAAPTVLTTYTTNMLNLALTMNGEEVDATTFGDTFRDYEQSFKSGSFAATYEYTDAIWTELWTDFANGTELNFEYSPVGTASTKPKLTGKVIATSFNDGGGVGTLKQIEINWRISEAPTAGAHS